MERAKVLEKIIKVFLYVYLMNCPKTSSKKNHTDL
jgi:hypothetical protein